METLKTKHQISSYIIDLQELEIKRIAMELHEGVSQNLYSIFTGLKYIETGTTDTKMKSYIREMEQQIEKTIQEIRMLSIELHPPALAAFGLLPAMKSYLKIYTSTFGILVDLESSGVEEPIPERNSIAVFRVCQEALANIAKYADTSNVKINFYWEEALLKIVIRDFGKGFNVGKEKSLGLAAMNERILLTGGETRISSTIGEGTTIEISLPL